MTDKNDLEDINSPPVSQRERKPSNLRPYFNKRDLQAQFAAMSRQPFIEILSELIQCAPSPDNIQKFADEHPDKWANTIKTMANLSGFNDKLEIEGNVNIDIQLKGDAELISQLGELQGHLKKLGISIPEQTVTDVEYEEVDTEKDPDL